jgi:hypothetical protein
MRPGFNQGLLVSQDFRTVNRHFMSAFENGLKSQTTVSPYCEAVFARAYNGEDLSVKKLLFMTLLCQVPEIREYYESTCPPKKFTPWFNALRSHLDTFLAGKHRDGQSKCASATDAKYRNVAAFVGAMVASYVGF